MEESIANGETLKRELKKKLTEILSYGGKIKTRGESDGVLEAIDEAISILNLMREASEQTYEKRYVTEWLNHEHNCPKSNAVLSHDLWTTNELVDELIKQWCRANKYEVLKPSDEIVTEQFKDGIKSLLQRISSSTSSVEDQTEAANELRRQAKKCVSVRAFFVSEIPDSITQLLSPLSAVDSNPDLEKNVITALRYMSTFVQNKRVIAENPLVIPLLTKSLKQGTTETRRNSAAALLSLSVIDSNKIIIGNSDTLKALIDLIREGDFSATIEAVSAVFNLCILLENREKAVSEGLIPVLTNKFQVGSNVKHLLAVLALMSTDNRANEAMMAMEELNHLVELPMVLVEEIVARVPVETLIRFRSISRGFYNRAIETDYMYKHLDMSQKRFLRLDDEVHIINPVANSHRSSQIPDCLNYVTFITTIIHCDGLVLFRNPNLSSLTLWNPFTKQLHWIEAMELLSEYDFYGMWDIVRRNADGIRYYEYTTHIRKKGTL